MKFLKRFFIAILILYWGLYIWGKIYSIEPDLVTLPAIADTNRIKTDLFYLSKICKYRNFMHPDQLDRSAEYIKDQFLTVTDSVVFQKFQVEEEEFKNVICSMGPADADRIIIGAHYDACLDKEGADDNASGVCGLLELARTLKKEKLQYRIDFVAYANEEPPFFGTKNMGSYVHAQSLFDAKVKVKGMICLEMIGYYSDEPNSQDYPVFFLEWFYGNKGDFITVAQKNFNGSFGAFIRERMKTDQVIRTKSFTAPSWAGGVDLSDHSNYWKFGWSAVMITNTAFYRNRLYHTDGDVAERLNIPKMALVTDELHRTILDIR